MYPLLSKQTGITPTKKIQTISGYSRLRDELGEMDSSIAAYQLSSFYSHLMCQERRYRDGIYFTPPDLAARVIEDITAAYSGDISQAKIIDPSAGGGALLGPLSGQIRRDMKRCGVRPIHRLTRISNNVHGIEICKTLSELCEFFCLIELYPDIHWVETTIPKFQIIASDFLTKKYEGQSFDIVIGNPPFRRLTALEQSKYSAKYSESSNGGSNLYGIFIHKSLSLVKPGGVVSLIVPASLFAGARYADLRSYITSQADVHSIQTIQKRVGVFMDVQQEAAIVTLIKSEPKVKRRAYTSISTICEKVESNYIGKCNLAKGKQPWVIPRSSKQADAASLFTKNLPRLANYGISIRTGSVVWNRDDRSRYSTRGSTNRPEITRYPLIWSDCIRADGTFVFEPTKHRTPKEIFVGTKSADPELIRGSAIALKRTSNSSQSRRIYCAFINQDFVREYGAYLGENHVNLLVPEEQSSSISLSLLSQVLNSTPIDTVFRCLSGSSAISKYELSRLPLPDVDCVQKRLGEGFDIDEAVRIGLYE